MRLTLDVQQLELRQKLREKFTDLMSEDLRQGLRDVDTHGEVRKKIIRLLGREGLLGIGWPTEYGGQGKGPAEQFIFYDEATRAGVPLPLVALNTVGPTLMKYGTADQKNEILPDILSGRIDVAVGYSESSAGTDLASLRTEAVRTCDSELGDCFVVNGSKLWTSNGDTADWIWLAARTDKVADKHKGLSILLVPTKDEGFSATRIDILRGDYVTATYYDDIRVPIRNVVGPVNGGWEIITTQLNHERIALAAQSARVIPLVESVHGWAQNTSIAGGGRVVDAPWVRDLLARCYVRVDALGLLNWKFLGELQRGDVSPAMSSALKIYCTETDREVNGYLLEVLGAAGYLKEDSTGAVLRGKVEQAYRDAVIPTFGGGANEVQREIVARFGLNVPRVVR